MLLNDVSIASKCERCCDSDGSDMDYEGETGHLPATLLNAYAEFMQTDHGRNNVITDDDTPSPPLSTVDHEPEAIRAMGGSQRS